jgi:cathepsin L
MLKNIVLALALAGSSARVISPSELSSYSFERFVKDFGKKYSPKESLEREKIFNAKLKEIVNHNAANRGWTETVNEMTDYTPAEFHARKGISKSMLFQNHEARSKMKPKPPRTDLPASVDWRDAGVVTSVKNQGHCGSCWTFSATEALESAVAISTGLLFTLSEQEFVSCVENPNECGGTGGCEGATMELAYEYAMANGLTDEWTTPYTSYNGVDGNCTLTADDTPVRVAGITGYTVTAQNSYDELLEAVATVGPVGITVDASQWSSYAGGVFDGCNQANPDLDHGVLLVGYGTDEATGQDYWLVRNSWGPAWGEAGYIRLARSDNESEKCGTDTTPSDGVGCAGGPTEVTVCGTCGILYDASYPTGAFLS